MTLQRLMKKARRIRGHSQEGAARTIGVNWSTWWRWEHAQQQPKGLCYNALRDYILAVLPEAADDLPDRYPVDAPILAK